MGFFDKKYCDICGEKIGLLGNRKLEDGNLCKECAKPSAKKCPVCGSYMVEKGNKLVCSQETCGYVEARQKDEKEN